MKTNRELLELAARAAGIELIAWEARRHAFKLPTERGNAPSRWNPITDDGDALRLAVNLRINIEHAETLSRKPHGVNCWPVGRGDCAWMELDIADYAAATRLSIVRAAAAIGEAMP